MPVQHALPERDTARFPSRVRLALLMMALGVSCRGGCRGDHEARLATPLAWLPLGTRVVLALDVAKVRATPLWTELAQAAGEDAQDQALLRALQEQTGFDPVRQVRRLVAAFPEDARTRGEFALFIEVSEPFDEERLIPFVRQRLEGQGGRLESQTVRGRTVYRSGADRATGGFFVGRHVLVLASGGWLEAVAALVDQVPGAASAERDSELARLVARANVSRSFWAAAVVPPEVRKALMADAKADQAASVMRLAASAELGPALEIDVTAELSNGADARALADRFSATLRAAKVSARMLLLGLGPYMDAVHARAEGPTLHLSARLPETQARDLVSRLAALVRLGRRQAAPEPRGPHASPPTGR